MTSVLLEDERVIKEDIVHLAGVHYAANKSGFYNLAQASLVMLRARVEDLNALAAPLQDVKP